MKVIISEEESVMMNCEVPSSATPKSTKLVGGTFFGPDFNLDAFKGIIISNSHLHTSSSYNSQHTLVHGIESFKTNVILCVFS
jgi:hypothetical protein